MSKGMMVATISAGMLALALMSAVPVAAQPYGGYGPGAWGGYCPGCGMGPGMMGYGMGPGMMGGYGPGYGMGPGMMHGYGPAYGISPRMMYGYGYGSGYGAGAELNLTDEQREKLDKIQQDLRSKQWDLTGKMRDEYARRASASDDADASRADDQIAALQQKMLSNANAARKQMDAVLTKQQRQQLRRDGY